MAKNRTRAWTSTVLHAGGGSERGEAIKGVFGRGAATDAAALGMVETFLMPGLMHSQRFRLRDARRGVDEIFRAQRVRHEINGTSARTFVWYGEEHGRY